MFGPVRDERTSGETRAASLAIMSWVVGSPLVACALRRRSSSDELAGRVEIGDPLAVRPFDRGSERRTSERAHFPPIFPLFGGRQLYRCPALTLPNASSLPFGETPGYVPVCQSRTGASTGVPPA